jgi:DNA helicase-2/ATP-dependent DNA helicase PcrA
MLAKLDEAPDSFLLARIGVEIYQEYQRSLTYRGAVDFDDLVRLAMDALETDPSFLQRLQERWTYILEDEAQDSSKLQNDMLRLLSGNRNWVRVGDPNQAIYTTFTTADSNFLRQFLAESDVADCPLQESGRSSPSIIALANELMRWATHDERMAHLHATFYFQEIRPTQPGDPQANPSDSLLYIDWDPDKNITPDAEIERVVRSLERWLPDHKDWTVAVLVPENSRGFKLAETLRERGIAYEELLRSTSATRDAAARLQIVFDTLAEPTNSRALARLFGLWWDTLYAPPTEQLEDEEDFDGAAHKGDGLREQIARDIQQVKAVEDFLWPTGERDWLAELQGVLEPEAVAALADFRAQAQFWLRASSLPVDQLVLTVAQTLFDAQADLALAHKIALVLRGISEMNPDYRLPHLAQELRLIAQNQRRFLGLEDATTGYAPRPGVVTVATMHAAKGLEWDRVYLMAVNNYSFPAAVAGDSYIAEKWFIRDGLNLQAEARHQAMLAMQGQAVSYVEGEASLEARKQYAAERLRLLYVGITRARRDLIITWNMGRYWEQGRRNEAAQALIALTHFWKQEAGA